MTVRHCVFVKFKDNLSQSEIEDMIADIHGMKNVIDGIISVNTGANISIEGLDRGNTHAFTLDFVNFEAVEAYLPHPAHQLVAQKLVSMLDGGIDGVTAIDFEISDV